MRFVTSIQRIERLLNWRGLLPVPLLVLFLLLFLGSPASAEETDYQLGRFLTNWLVLKPISVKVKTGGAIDEVALRQAFVCDWLAESGGEMQIRPHAGGTVEAGGRKLKWQTLVSGNGVFELPGDAHSMDNTVLYAWTTFRVTAKQRAFLSLGSDESAKVWLNGRLIHEHWIRRSVRIDEDLVPVELEVGENRVLLKVEDADGPAGFACRFLTGEQTAGVSMFRANMDHPGFDRLTDADIKRLLEDYIDADKLDVGLVVGIVDEHGALVVSHGRLDNGTDCEVDGDTLFGIGSVTKVFTALLLQDMIERGEMALNDPVQKYLPATVQLPKYQGKQITLLHLATHTSGLPRDPDGDMYAFLSHCTLQHSPGTHVEYSNLGMALLGHVIALKAGKDYETLLIERICRPLGMDSTRIALSPELKARLASGHARPGGRVDGYYGPSAFPGAGSIRSTANDLLKFVSAYAGLVPSPLNSVMQKAEEVHRLESGEEKRLVWEGDGTVFEHSGLTVNFRSELAFDRGRRRGIVVLSNCGNSSSFVPSIWRPLLEGRRPEPQHVAVADPACYNRLVGQYQTGQSQVVTVRHSGDRLIAQWIGNPLEYRREASEEIFPQSESVFYNEFWGSELMFLPATNGAPARLIVADTTQRRPLELTRISAEVPETPPVVHLASNRYDDFVGKYRKTLFFGLLRVGPVLKVSHTANEIGDHLMAFAPQLPGENSAELFPVDENAFIPSPTIVPNIKLTFLRNPKGEVNRVLIYWDGETACGTRISRK